jgi:hypothetical protein
VVEGGGRRRQRVEGGLIGRDVVVGQEEVRVGAVEDHNGYPITGTAACCARPLERPRSLRAADERDEVAPLHSITSSARASNVGGTSRPSALAVLRLITNSNFVGS